MSYLVDEDPITSALMSPGMAMAAQAAQNLTNMRMGGQVRSPIDAYQQAVFQRARLDQQRQSMLQQQKLTQLKRQQDNPFYEYEEALRLGYIPEGTTYPDFLKMGFKSSERPSAVREWEHYSSLTPEEQKEYLAMRRAQQVVATGGGGLGAVQPDGTVTPVVSGADATAADAERQRTIAFEKALGEDEASRSIGARKGIESIGSAFDVIDQIDTKQFDSIYGSGRGLLPLTDQKAIDTWATIEQLTGKLTLSEREKLRGQGTITDDESRMLGQSVQILSQRRISPERARQEVDNIISILTNRESELRPYLIENESSGTTGGDSKITGPSRPGG